MTFLNLVYKTLCSLIFLISLTLSKSVYAQDIQPITIGKFSDINKYIEDFKEGDLVIFDIDGVILTPTDTILKSKYRETRHKFLDNLKQELGEKQFKDLYGKMVIQFGAEFVENDFPKFFYGIKSKQAKVIALTLMGPNNPYIDQEKDRVHYLTKMGINFDNLYRRKNIVIEHPSKRPQPLFDSGVIFSRGYDKGKVLIKFLEDIEFKPKRIIFIDDRKDHAQTVAQALCSNNISGYSFHYNHNKKAKKIDKCVVNKQFEWLKSQHIWLSDRQALILCKEKKYYKYYESPN
jgi:hypothetical protein